MVPPQSDGVRVWCWLVHGWHHLSPLWDLETEQSRAALKGHQGSVACLTFSPNGTLLASGNGDETIKLWNPAIGTESATLRGHRSGVTAVAFSPNGKTLTSAGVDDAIRICNLALQD